MNICHESIVLIQELMMMMMMMMIWCVPRRFKHWSADFIALNLAFNWSYSPTDPDLNDDILVKHRSACFVSFAQKGHFTLALVIEMNGSF